MDDDLPEVDRRLNDAFTSFTDSLRELLTAEARRSVDGAIERLTVSSGPLRLQDVDVEIVIRNLNISATDAEGALKAAGSAAKPASRPARRAAQSGQKRRRGKAAAGSAPQRSAGRGRPPGELRRAILDEFSTETGDLDLAGIRDRLVARKVETTADNLHQQLRRLVTAGEIERVARGVYRRAQTAST